MAWVKFALERSALLKLAPVRFAREKEAFSRVAELKSASERLALSKLAFERLADANRQPRRSQFLSETSERLSP